jgi:polysaccharide export outer membrane protein
MQGRRQEKMRKVLGLALTGWLMAAAQGQQAPAPAPAPAPGAAAAAPAQEEAPRPVYLLSPGDQIVIRAQNVEEISEKPFRIDGEGFLNLPVVGRIRAAGLTVEQLEAALVDRWGRSSSRGYTRWGRGRRRWGRC